MLLQVTEPGYAAGGSHQERQLWLDALSEPEVLHQLVQYTCQCAASCAPAVTTGAAAAADDALLYACQLLLNIVAAEREEREPQQQRGPVEEQHHQQQQSRQQLVSDPELVPLLQRLLHLAHLRPVVPPAECSPDQTLHAARWVALCACLLDAVRLWMTHMWQL